jgi:hypothetical protein
LNWFQENQKDKLYFKYQLKVFGKSLKLALLMMVVVVVVVVGA